MIPQTQMQTQAEQTHKYIHAKKISTRPRKQIPADDDNDDDNDDDDYDDDDFCVPYVIVRYLFVFPLFQSIALY